MTHKQFPTQNLTGEGVVPREKPGVVSQVAGAAALSANLPPAQTSHREGYWQEPTADQIAHAAKYGFDLTKQNKY